MIAGTALGVLNSGMLNGNGILGGLLGGNGGLGNNATAGAMVSNALDAKYETKESALLRERIAKLESEKYTDKVGIDVYREAIALSNKNDDRIRENYKELAQEAAANLVRQARMEEQIKCLQNTMNLRIDNTNQMFGMQLANTNQFFRNEIDNTNQMFKTEMANTNKLLGMEIANTNERIHTAQAEVMHEIKNLAINTREKIEGLRAETQAAVSLEAERRSCGDDKLQAAVSLEAERRSCGDDKLYAYCNGTFVPGKLIMPLDSICPPAAPKA